MLFALALLTAMPVIGQDNSDAKASFARANEYIAENNYRAARIEILNALSADPDWTDARITQAKIYLKLKDPIAAEAEIKRARESGADDADVRHLMGQALLMQGKFERSIDVLTSGEIVEDYAGYAKRILAEAHLALQQRDAARRAFDDAIRINDQDSDLWISISRFRFGGGDEKGAIEAAELAVMLDEKNVEALLYRGELARRQLGLTYALPWFERALDIDPDHIPTLTAYAQTLGDVGRYKDMLGTARRLLSLEPGNAYGYYFQAVLAARAGEYSLARSLMQVIAGRLDTQAAPALLLCTLELQADNAVKAREFCENVLKKQPNNVSAQQLLMRSLLISGEMEELQSYFDDGRFSSVTPGYSAAIMALGHQLSDDLDSAVEHINKASQSPSIFFRLLGEPEATSRLIFMIDKEPGNVRHRVRYIRKLLNNGQGNLAWAQAQRLQKQFPQYADSNLLAGDVEIVRGNYARALGYFENAASVRFSFDIMVRMHDMLAQLGRGEQMEGLLKQFLASNPHNIDAKHMLGLAYLDGGKPELARSVLQEVRLRLGENTPLLLADLATAQLRAGDEDAARITAGKAYALLPMNAPVTFSYAQTLWSAENRRRDALDLYEKAVALASDNKLYRDRLKAARSELGA